MVLSMTILCGLVEGLPTRRSASNALSDAEMVASEILGHASVQVTGDIYGRVSTEGARSAMDRLAQALGW